jgi:hypothetical protein
MALKAMPAEHPTTDHGHASSHLLARSLVTYSNERYEDRILPFGTPTTPSTTPPTSTPATLLTADLRRINAAPH